MIYDLGIIACGKKKQNKKVRAEYLYQGGYFKSAKEYAIRNSAKVIILSAKHGLVELQKELEPYDYTLKGKNIATKKKWAVEVLKSLTPFLINNNVKSILWLAGKEYNQYLMPESAKIVDMQSWPTKGLGMGRQISFFKQQLNKTNEIIFSNDRG